MKRPILKLLLLSGAVATGIMAAMHVGPLGASGPPPIDPTAMCAQTPGQCHAITSRDEALARVSDEIKAISGGTLPSRIDVTEQAVGVVNKEFGEATQLPTDRLVWYVRIYNPVTLTGQAGAYLAPRVTSLSKAHGAAWIIDSQTGLVMAFGAFD
jgi:hypothetical protein